MRTSFKRPDVAQCSHREAMDGSTDRLSRKTRSVSAITVFSVTRIKREHVHADLEHVHAPLSRRRRPTRVLAPQRCTNLRVLGPGSQVPRRGTAARLPTRRPQVVFESELLSAPLHRNGTFLELGAHDGVAVSNTVWFERALGWSGVLIEASSKAFRSLVQHRGGGGNSLHNAVICPRGQTVTYREPHSLASVTMAGIDASMPAANKRYRDNRNASLRELPCRPLSELLAATRVAKVRA